MMRILKLSLYLLLFFFFFFESDAQTGHHANNRLAGIDTLLLDIIKSHHAAGLSVAVVEKGVIVYSRGLGYRDVRARKPVTPNTLFAIGSCTKAFTASLIGQLQEKGRLALDDKIADRLPGLRFYNDNMNNTITLRDMLCHRTGLSRYENAWYYFNTMARDSLLEKVRYMKPTAGIREKWQYNNFMYLALGRVTEKLTGKPWETNIKENIFAPLDMLRSNTSIHLMATDEDAAKGYGPENDPKERDYYEVEGMAPAGGINSTANDMAAWLITWLNGGRYKGKDIIPHDFVESATSSQMVVYGALPGSNDQKDIFLLNYGLGWFIRSHRGHYEVEHDGNIDGFSSWISLFPTDSLGIVVMTNQHNSEIPQLVSTILADRMLKLAPSVAELIRGGNTPKNPSTNSPAPISGRIANTNPSHPVTEYQGYFENPAYGSIRLYLRQDSLFASIGKQLFWLMHYHYDVFEARKITGRGIDTSTTDLRINFRFAGNGKIESITLPLEANTNPMVEFTYVQKAIILDKKELEKYTGEYELAGELAKVYIKDTSLFILAPGQPEFQLIATGNHHFDLSSLQGYNIQFEVTDGEVRGLTLTKSDGTSFKIPKKK